MGAVTVLSFANYSKAVVAKDSNRDELVDYSNEILSKEPSTLQTIGVKLAKVASEIEQMYDGVAQDIEGALVLEGGEFQVFVVQTRT